MMDARRAEYIAQVLRGYLMEREVRVTPQAIVVGDEGGKHLLIAEDDTREGWFVVGRYRGHLGGFVSTCLQGDLLAAVRLLWTGDLV